MSSNKRGNRNGEAEGQDAGNSEIIQGGGEVNPEDEAKG